MTILGASERIPGLFLDNGGAVINLGHPEYAPDRTGVALARTAIRAALDAVVLAADQYGAATLWMPPGNYNVGPLAPFEQVFQLINKSGISVVSPGARLICNTSSFPSQPLLFAMDGCEKMTFEGIRMRDDGTVVGVDWRGAHLFACFANSPPLGSKLRGFAFRSCWSEKGVSFLTVSGQSLATRMEHIRIDNCGAIDTYYGMNFNENGDDVVVTNFKAINCRRSYFAYGGKHHRIDLRITHDGISPGANSAIMIKRYVYDTRDVKVRASFSGNGARLQHGATMEHQGDHFPTTVQAAPAPTASAFGIGAGQGVNYFAGETITVNGATALVRSIAGDVVTLETPLDFTPVAGQAVNAISTISDIDVDLHFDPSFQQAHTTVQAAPAPTASVFTVAAGTGVNYSAGQTVLVNGVATVLLAAIGDELTLVSALPFVPVAGQRVSSVTVPYMFRSYTPGGVLESTTTNSTDRVTLRGALGGGTTSPVIEFASIQASEGRLVLDPSLSHGPDHYPGFVARLAHDREVRTKAGDLSVNTTASPTLAIPLSGVEGRGFNLEVSLYVQDNASATAAQNTVYRRDTIIGYNAVGGAVVIQSTTNHFIHAQGTPPTVAYAASGETITCTLGGAAYIGAAGANAIARMEVKYAGRGQARTV